MIPCLGGWCLSRERCAHYYAQSDLTPSERLCGEVEEIEPLGHEVRTLDHRKIHRDGGTGLCAHA